MTRSQMLNQFREAAAFTFSSDLILRHALRAAFIGFSMFAVRKCGVPAPDPMVVALGAFVGARLYDAQSFMVRCGAWRRERARTHGLH